MCVCVCVHVHSPDRAAFALRAHAALSGECNYYVCMHACVCVCVRACVLSTILGAMYTFRYIHVLKNVLNVHRYTC